LELLKPLWRATPETATRLRGRIEAVLNRAKVQNLRSGENPAAWKGNLALLLPARDPLSRKHHPALPYDELPKFMGELRARQGLAAVALELTILTVVRTNEMLGARWSEFDLEKRLWIVPASRMKAKKAHRIPLCDRAIELLTQLREARLGDLVFPGSKPAKPMSSMSMLMLLRRMRPGVTTHGFRSTFRDWASEQTSFPNETCEHVLAHRISDKAEASYRRGDQFKKRTALMNAWAAYCEPKEGKVSQLKGTLNR
jgi:integrase